MRIGLLILTLAGALAAADSKDIHRTVPLDANGRLVIHTYKGSVRVSAWDRNEVDVALRIEEDWGWMAESIRHADLGVDARRTEVQLESRYEKSPFTFSGSQPLFHYTIRMPRSASLRIKDYKSETEVEGLSGDLDVYTYKGLLNVREQAGGLTVNTYKGQVRADFTAFNTRSQVETYKGTVELGLPRGSRFDLRADMGHKGGLDSDFGQARGIGASRVGFRRHSNTYVNDAINGGGPELRLKSHKGTFRVWER